METVTRYQQKRWIVLDYGFAPRMMKVTDYFLPREGIIIYTDGQDLLKTEDADEPRLEVQDQDHVGVRSFADNVEEVQMKREIYSAVVEWHHITIREKELRLKLEDAFFFDEGDF